MNASLSLQACRSSRSPLSRAEIRRQWGPWILLVPLLCAAAWCRAETATLGHWSGNARFLERAADEKYGTVPVTLTLRSDLTIAGRIGMATIPVSSIAPRSGHHAKGVREFRFVVSEPLVRDPSFKRTHVVMLVQAKADVLDVDIHLKTRFGFDAGMKVLNAQLIAQPSARPRAQLPKAQPPNAQPRPEPAPERIALHPEAMHALRSSLSATAQG